jgi:hypothetical protein
VCSEAQYTGKYPASGVRRAQLVRYGSRHAAFGTESVLDARPSFAVSVSEIETAVTVITLPRVDIDGVMVAHNRVVQCGDNAIERAGRDFCYRPLIDAGRAAFWLPFATSRWSASLV